tara:strand:+ start:89 stop:322 length:234 start_codon:yes stop_codon:yes gene_type:complete
MSKVIYEPHPISAARKAKLQAEGYKILDAVFAPAGTPIQQSIDVEELPEEVEVEEAEPEVSEETDIPKKRGRSKKGY